MTSTEPLRVLQIVEATDGGVGRHVLDLCGELVGRGHEIHAVYSPERMDDGFWTRMRSIEGLRSSAIPMRRSPHPSDLVALLRLVAYARKHGPFSLLHGHSSKGGALARLAGMLTGLPVVYTPNAFRTADPTVQPVLRFLYGLAERMLGVAGSHVIAVSEDERNHAIDLGLDPGHVHVCFNGISEEPVQELPDRTKLKIPADAIVIGFVGRLAHQKAPERLLDVALRLNLPAVHWVMVGDGPLAKTLGARCRENGLASSFHWVGARNGHAMMRIFDVLALPSRYEGFAYVLIEALQCGLPIVVNDVGGARHAVRDGVNGFVCREGDLESFAAGIRRLVEDARLRSEMSRESRKRSQFFTLTRMVERTEQVYRVALGSRS